MTDNDEKNNQPPEEQEEVTKSDKIWLTGGAIVIGVMILGFINLMINDGPSAAFDQAPGPALLFVIACVVGWFVLSGYFQDKGAEKIGKSMWSIGKIAIVLFFLTIFLSKCGVDVTDSDLRPPQSL